MSAACQNCQRPYDSPFALQCRACGFWNQGVGTTSISKAKTTTLDQVQSASVERIKIGAPWDEVWGGGFVPSSVTIIGGQPGGGKTSALLQIASKLAQVTGKRSYFLSAEMSPNEVKTMVERLGLAPKLFRVLTAMGGSPEIDQDLLKEDPPSSITVDSISAMCGRNLQLQVLTVKSYKRLAVAHRAPCFLVNHVQKENFFAGGMATLHEADTLIGLDSSADRHALSDLKAKGYSRAELDHYFDQLRIIEPIKNRHGPMFVRTALLMTPTGLIALPPPGSQQIESHPDDDDEEMPEPPRTRGRRQRAPDSIERQGQLLRLVSKRRDSDGDDKGPGAA